MTFVITYGTSWNGQESTWQPFVAWFLHQADAHGAGLAARAFIAGAETAADKVDFFRHNGIPLTPPVAEPPPDLTGDWPAFRTVYGNSWNGDESTWYPFVAWFHHHARANQVSDEAQTFTTAAEAAPDKVDFFRHNGIPVRRRETPDQVTPTR